MWRKSLLTSFVLMISVAMVWSADFDQARQLDEVIAKYDRGESLTMEEKILIAPELTVRESAVNTNDAVIQSGGLRSALDEGFEGTWPPAGWTIIDVDGGNGYNETFSYIPAHTGSQGAQAMGCADDYLITPQLDVTDGDNTFSFWYGQESTNYENSFEVMVSTAGTEIADFVQVLDSANTAPTFDDEWRQVTIDLSAYNGQQVYVALHTYYSESSWYDFGFDDVLGPEVYLAAEPPMAAVPVSPADSAMDVSIFADLSWTVDIATTGSMLYFGTDNPPTNIENGTDLGAVTAFNPGALDGETEYFWQVVAYNEHGNADASDIFMFTTEVDPTVMVPYFENMDSFQGWDGDYAPPAGWSKFSGLLGPTTDLVPTTSGWIADDFANNTDNTICGRLNIYGTSRKHWMMTPPVDLGDGSTGYALSFDLAYTEYANQNPATLGDDDLFAVVIATDGETFSDANILQAWDSTTPISNTGEQVMIDLSGYTGVVKIGFYGETTVSNEDNDMFVDNVKIAEPPSMYEGVVMVNEIHYNPASDQGSDDDFEFAELYNAGDTPIDMTGWTLNDVALDVTIEADSFVVVAFTGATYAALDAPVVDAGGYFGLSNTASDVTVIDAAGLVVDFVEYTDDPPWPSSADGGGPSMELMDAMYDNGMGESWQASFVMGGTPGMSNSSAPPAIPYTINELQTVDHSGDMVSTGGIVMSVFEGLYTIQESPGAFSGIWVAGGDVAVGDSVTVEGIVGESYDLTQITAANTIIHGSDYELFPPEMLATGAISMEDYEGVFVYAMGACDNPDLGFGEWSIDDGSGPVAIDDLGYVASPTLGVEYEVVGPLYYSFGSFKIEPRDEMDVIDWSPGNYCENPLVYGVAGDPTATGSIESYGAAWYVVETLEDYDSLYVSLCGSDFDTKLEVWAACDDEGYLAYNDDNYAVCGPGNNSHIEMLAVPAGLYYVKVYGWSSSFGTYALNIWGANGIAPGSTCDTAIDAVMGENAADGSAQWFAYTATMDGIVKITSQNETGDAPWDTRLDVYDGCDEEAVMVASNDDCCGYWGPSTVEFLAAAGMTYYMFWDDIYGPGPFPFFIEENENAPSNLMAEGHDGFVDLAWMPPVGAVIASNNDVSIAATNNNNSVQKLAQIKADGQAALEAKRADAPAIRDLTTEQKLNMTPLNRHRAILFPIHVENSGLRTSDVTVSVTVDAYPSEGSWNVYDYTAAAYLYAEDQLFTAGGENQTVVLTLEDGLYSVDVWDSYGDGGIEGLVTLGDGTVLTSWGGGDYTTFGEFGFTILEGAVYGCTDPLALNYDPTATLDDGSCYYEGDFCDVAIPVVDGMNAASGDLQWFSYTATMDGEISVSSQNEAGDAAWDTYVFIFDSCDPEAAPIASNDDGYGYVGPSLVEFPSFTGTTYYIAWDPIWGPGPFEFWLDEHELILCDDTIVPDGVAEVEPNSGANVDPVEYDPRACGDLITGTYWADTENRDTDWFNFTLDQHSMIEAWVDVACGDPMIFIIDDAINIVAQGTDNGEGMGEALMTGILPPGDYWFWVGSQVFDGIGTEFNYNAGFTCTPMEPTSYTVYRSDLEDPVATGIFDMFYTDGSVMNGTEYCYTVTATMDGVETGESNEACATPNVFFPEPQGLMAAAFDAEVQLGWSPPFPMGQLAYDDGTAESWYWVGGPSIMDHMFFARLMVPTDGVVSHIAVWHAADALVNWTAISVTGDDGTGAPDLGNAYEVFVDVPVETPIGAGGEWAVLELSTPAAVTAGQALYIVTQWPDASEVGPFVATDDDTDLGNGAWSNTGGASWNVIPGTFIMRAYMQAAETRENIEITAVPRDVEANLPVRSFDENKTLDGKMESISFSLAAPELQSNAMRDLTGYNVYRGEEPGVLTLLETTTDEFFADMTVSNGTAYFYAVTALYDGTSESGFSNEVLALPLGAGTVPYGNNFDTDDGGFFGGGEWQWGAPLDPPGAASAPNVWGTILDGPHSSGVTSFLEMPFDLSGSPYGYELSFMSFQDIEENWDYGYVGVDHDGDANYDIVAVFTGQLGEWLYESVIIPAELTSAYTKIAFIFQADGSVTYDGWYIDDVEVNEFMPAIMTVTPDVISETIEFPETNSTHDFVIGNIGGLDLEYYGMIEYIDGVTLDTLFFEDFETGLSRWSVVDGADDGLTWEGVVDFTGNSVDGTPFAFVNSDAAGSVDMYEELISPVVDTEDALSLMLEWDQYFNAYSGNEMGDVDVWDGVEWVNVYSTSEDMGYWLDPDHPVIDITPFASADLQVRFHYHNANYDWYWAVDNVVITVEEGVPWITVDGGVAFDGMIATGGGDNTHLLSLNTDGLDNGTYLANVHLVSNGGMMTVPVELVVTGIVSTDDHLVPDTYALHQNYPNPFNPVTSIQFDLPEATDVRIVVYNVLGQKVATLVEEHKTAGIHHVMWTGTDQLGASVSSGVYLYRIETENFSDVKKLMLLK